MIFGYRTKTDLIPSLKISNVPIPYRDEGKFLGLTIDSRLLFSKHIQYTCSKVSKSIGVIYKLKSLLPLACLRNRYYAMVYPYLMYCVCAWGATYNCHLQPLFLLQKRVIRIIGNGDFLSHTNPLFQTTNTLKLHDIYKLNLAVYFYRNESYKISDDLMITIPDRLILSTHVS